MPTTENTTRENVRRSTIWVTNSKILSQSFGFITTLVLARLLDRVDFGLMAMALSFMGLVDTFVDLGFLSAIIQAKEIDRRQLSSCFWLLSLLSVVATLVVLILAPMISVAFAEPGVTVLLYWLSPLFLLAPINIICKGTLSRNLRLDVLAKIELFASIPKMGLSILLAIAGFGVFSLVMGYIFERILLTLWCIFETRWYPLFVYDWKRAKQLLTFGFKTSLSGLLWYLNTKAGVFVIGRVLGAEVLGVYTIASQFPQTIARLVPSTWHRIAYPLFARYQHSPELKQVVTRSSSLLLLVSLPLFAGLAAVSSDVIDVFFGDRWQGAVFSLQMLSVVAAFETVTWTLSAALNAIGRPGINTLINMVAVFVFPVMLYFGAVNWGLDGLLWASVIAYLYRFLAMLLFTCRLLELKVWFFVKAHLGSLAAALIMYVCVVLLYRWGGAWNIYVRITSCIVFGAATYLVVLLFINRQQISQLRSYMKTTKESL